MIGAIFYSNPFGGLLVGALLLAAGRPIIVKVARRREKKPWLRCRILTISLVLHLLAGPGQIYVIDHFYNGVADWNRYVNRGALLAPNFRHFDFNIRPGSIGGLVNNGSVSIATGIVFAIFGINQIGAFFVFAFLSWVGCILFFRAFSLTFGGVGSRRYAYVLFFLPSIIFWTADVSKEAIIADAPSAARGLLRSGQDPLPPQGWDLPGDPRLCDRHLHPAQRAARGDGRVPPVAMMVAPSTGRRKRAGEPGG